MTLAPNKWLVWEDLSLGPAGTVRPDVLSIGKSFVAPQPTIYEIKVTRADLMADLSAGKSLQYFKYAQRVVFCFPAGMAKKEEVPPEFGVMTRGEQSWRTARRAPMRELPVWGRDVWMKLLMDGVRREASVARKELWQAIRTEDQARRSLSDDYQAWLQDRAAAERNLAFLQAEVQATKQALAALTAEEKEWLASVAEVVGARSTSKSDIQFRIEQIKKGGIPEAEARAARFAAQEAARSIGRLIERLG